MPPLPLHHAAGAAMTWQDTLVEAGVMALVIAMCLLGFYVIVVMVPQ